MERIIVVLGGNAFVRAGERPTMAGQLRFAHEALSRLAPLVRENTQLLISHGNGPQVGHMLTRVEEALGKAYALPLEVCVAESEGELGYVLEQALINLLTQQGLPRRTAALLTQVVVDPSDPAMQQPTKPIGIFYSAEQAATLRARGFDIMEDAGRGFRRVVPSPAPLEILGAEVIDALLAQGVIVIAAGGGGIPVVRRDGRLEGIEAVIDKDATGALLAERLDATQFIILTDMPNACRNFGTPDQTAIDAVSAREADALISEGHFATGSMLPKMQAAARFARRTGRPALICNPSNLAAALQGHAGTRIVPNENASRETTTAKRSTSTGTRRTHNCLILGAAGRDFHNFQTFFRAHPEFRVRAFTATQIPFIASRRFPRALAGPEYDADIPIHLESQLPDLIAELDIDFVFLAYSDLSHVEVMHKASIAHAGGASFALLGPRHTQLVPRCPVVSVTAVRTGAGKSPICQWLARELTRAGHRLGILRHPMPYGDLERQAVERFASWQDLERYQCTVEEQEEYVPYLELGLTIYAGVDYARIVAEAERSADLLLWDGGNNDFSFLRPTVSIVVADALRPGHETSYHPGETNARSADILVINKIRGASDETLERLRRTLRELNPRAEQIEADLAIELSSPERVAGRRVLVVEDGPTLTHGGMSFGAGMLAARRAGAAQIIDPRPAAVGTIAAAYREFPHLGSVLPALGYSAEQRAELEETIRRSRAEVVIDASPARLERLVNIDLPVVRVSYRFEQLAGRPLLELVRERLSVLKSP